ncbi:phage tail protein, partial [Citrobacter freundii]
RWDGAFPKVVPAGSTPDSTGGKGDGAWVGVGDAAFRQEANKKFKFSVKLSDYLTLQDAASAAVDGLLIDREYNFTDNETVDFGGKVLTIICKESFVADGSLVFTNLGYGSTIENISLKSESTPFVIYRFDDNDAWLDSESVLAGLSQRRDKGYQPTVNDIDIWSSLSTEIQNQNINCELILGANCSGVTITHPTGEFAIIRSIMNNNVTIQDPDFLGGKGGFGSIVFANYDGTGYGYGNRVIGGRVRYGSFSSVAFLRNKGYEGGVWGFDSYRCGESGVKTWQNEVGPRSARCYELTFESITTTQCYYDGIDCNADYGTVTTRVDDYPVSQYPSGQLPTKHRIRNIFTEDAKGVGAWWDGRGVYVENVTTKDAHKTGIWSRGTSCILVNLTTIGCNSDNGSYNHLTCEGSDQIIGASVTVYSAISGYAIYAPGSEASNIYTNKGLGPGAVLLTAINNTRLGNTEIASQTSTVTLRLRPSAFLVSNDGVKIDAVTQISTPGNESVSLTLSPVQGGAYPKSLSVNVGGTGQAIIPSANDLIADSALTQNGTLAFYFESGVLKVIYRRPDGTYNRIAIG